MTAGPPPPVLRVRSESIEWRVIDGEVVALDLGSLRYLHLNHTGAELWQLLADGTTEPEMIRHLVQTHGVSPAQAEADLKAFLASLTAQRLLQSGGSGDDA